ncbi:hypothetical protein Trydic_g10132 [Trypoxylus dichotomus]
MGRDGFIGDVRSEKEMDVRLIAASRSDHRERQRDIAREDVKPLEILRRLTAQYAEKTVSGTQVYDWHEEFSDGRELVENKSAIEANIRGILQYEKFLLTSKYHTGVPNQSFQMICVKEKCWQSEFHDS